MSLLLPLPRPQLYKSRKFQALSQHLKAGITAEQLLEQRPASDSGTAPSTPLRSIPGAAPIDVEGEKTKRLEQARQEYQVRRQEAVAQQQGPLAFARQPTFAMRPAAVPQSELLAARIRAVSTPGALEAVHEDGDSADAQLSMRQRVPGVSSSGTIVGGGSQPGSPSVSSSGATSKRSAVISGVDQARVVGEEGSEADEGAASGGLVHELDARVLRSRSTPNIPEDEISSYGAVATAAVAAAVAGDRDAGAGAVTAISSAASRAASVSGVAPANRAASTSGAATAADAGVDAVSGLPSRGTSTAGVPPQPSSHAMSVAGGASREPQGPGFGLGPGTTGAHVVGAAEGEVQPQHAAVVRHRSQAQLSELEEAAQAQLDALAQEPSADPAAGAPRPSIAGWEVKGPAAAHGVSLRPGATAAVAARATSPASASPVAVVTRAVSPVAGTGVPSRGTSLAAAAGSDVRSGATRAAGQVAGGAAGSPSASVLPPASVAPRTLPAAAATAHHTAAGSVGIPTEGGRQDLSLPRAAAPGATSPGMGASAASVSGVAVGSAAGAAAGTGGVPLGVGGVSPAGVASDMVLPSTSPAGSIGTAPGTPRSYHHAQLAGLSAPAGLHGPVGLHGVHAPHGSGAAHADKHFICLDFHPKPIPAPRPRGTSPIHGSSYYPYQLQPWQPGSPQTSPAAARSPEHMSASGAGEATEANIGSGSLQISSTPVDAEASHEAADVTMSPFANQPDASGCSPATAATAPASPSHSSFVPLSTKQPHGAAAAGGGWAHRGPSQQPAFTAPPQDWGWATQQEAGGTPAWLERLAARTALAHKLGMSNGSAGRQRFERAQARQQHLRAAAPSMSEAVRITKPLPPPMPANDPTNPYFAALPGTYSRPVSVGMGSPPRRDGSPHGIGFSGVVAAVPRPYSNLSPPRPSVPTGMVEVLTPFGPRVVASPAAVSSIPSSPKQSSNQRATTGMSTRHAGHTQLFGRSSVPALAAASPLYISCVAGAQHTETGLDVRSSAPASLLKLPKV